MNAEIFTTLSDHLEGRVPELRWIDFDEGQLNIQGERPPVSFPCCLIDLQYIDCKDLDEDTQLVTTNIILKLGFMPNGETYNKAPKEIRGKALDVFNEVEKIHKALQGETLGGMVSPISRRRAVKTVRKDKIIVFTVTYNTTFQEII